jgi:2,4-dienoyl-CoA reductase-like NADH-dependent reductase (Old Yellow Enzyme family)
MPSQSSAMSDAQVQPAQFGRRKLFDRVWSKPMTTNATELGTSASTLSTLAKRASACRCRVPATG